MSSTSGYDKSIDSLFLFKYKIVLSSFIFSPVLHVTYDFRLVCCIFFDFYYQIDVFVFKIGLGGIYLTTGCKQILALQPQLNLMP